jgi:hypothetical protein
VARGVREACGGELGPEVGELRSNSPACRARAFVRTIVEPGGITSEFAASALRQVEATGGIRDDEYRPLLMRYVGGAQARQGEGVYQTSDEVAKVVVGVIEASDPPIRKRTSSWGEAFCALKTDLDPDGRTLRDQVFERFLGGSQLPT